VLIIADVFIGDKVTISMDQYFNIEELDPTPSTLRTATLRETSNSRNLAADADVLAPACDPYNLSAVATLMYST